MTKNTSTPRNPPLKPGTPAWKKTTDSALMARKPSISDRYGLGMPRRAEPRALQPVRQAPDAFCSGRPTPVDRHTVKQQTRATRRAAADSYAQWPIQGVGTCNRWGRQSTESPQELRTLVASHWNAKPRAIVL